MCDVTPGRPIWLPLMVPVIAQSTTLPRIAVTISANGITTGIAPSAAISSD